jgi:uncharacterized protein (UPF0276 family)
MPPLGVGLVYWTALEPLFESGAAAVLELEPQTLWTKSAGADGFAYRLNEGLFERIARLPQPKLMHGVGQPVGGTVDDPIGHLPLLRQMADRIDPPWVSEHLSFNRVERGGVQEAGFLLPPLQRPAGARVAAANLQRYRRALDRPVAFETGVNYFRPAADDLPEGEFFRAVAEQADCGILLDLHNLWCNERNGRSRVVDALAQMPLERVWEVHLAGGMSLNGYWLDGHSGAVPPAVIEIAAQVLPRLAHVGALIFEILPEHLPGLGLDGVQRELETLQALWRLRPARALKVPSAGASDLAPAAADIAEVRAWEIAVADALDGAEIEPFAHDPGRDVMRRLIRDFRSANVTKALRFTITALLAAIGADATRALLDAYFRAAPPDTFAAAEAHRFARFLRGRSNLLCAVPYLAEVLAFEQALLAATLYGETTEVQWSADPTRLLDELRDGRLPRDLPRMDSTMVISS